MAISRYDQFLDNDYSFQQYQPQEWQPNLEVMDNALTGLQTEYDTGLGELERIMPNYLRQSDSDTQAAKEFRSKYDNLIAQTTDAFTKGNINEGRRMMREGLREIEKDQLPGGDYYELERRVDEYKNIVDKYNEMYKDAPGEYLPEILNRVKITDFRNPKTGEAQSIIDPNMGAYVNIGEELNKRLDGFKSDKGTVIKIGDRWIYEESREEVKDSDIQRAAQKILSEPRFRQQLGLETDMFTRGINENAIQEYKLQNAQSTLPSNPRQLQKFLKKQGYYEGSIDGIIGDQTKGAVNNYLQKQMSAPVTAQELAADRVMRNYIEPVVDKYGFKRIDKSVKANQFAVEKEKLDYLNYNPFAGVTIPGRTQDTKNHSFTNSKEIEAKNKNLSRNIDTKLQRLAQEAGVSNAENLFGLSDEDLLSRGISPQKVRSVQYQVQQGRKQIKINEQLRKEAETEAAKKYSIATQEGYQKAMQQMESMLPEVLTAVQGYEKFGESDITKDEAIAAIKKGNYKSMGVGSSIGVYNDRGELISRLPGSEGKAFIEAASYYQDNIGSKMRAYENEVDSYVKSTQQGRMYQPELFTSIPIRDDSGEINPTLTKNATSFMQDFVQNPTNIARYKYIDKDGDEQYYQFSNFVDDLPVGSDGNVDFNQMNLTFSGVTKDQNPAFGTPTFELSYINDDAEVKTLHAPVPKEVSERIVYPGGKKPEDGNIQGNTGWNLKQEGSWKANGLLQEAQYQPAKVYDTDYGTFYLDKHPVTEKEISSQQQFVFMTPEGTELSGQEYKDYIIGSYIQEKLGQ